MKMSHISFQNTEQTWCQSSTRSSAVAVIADRTACKFAVRTPLRVHCSRHSAVSAHVSARAPNGTVPTRGCTNAVTCVLGLRCASFCGAFYGWTMHRRAKVSKGTNRNFDARNTLV